MSSAFIIGCGYTGRRLAARLLQAGEQVSAISRTGEELPGLAIQAGDLLQPESLQLQPAAGRLVYYMAPPLFRRYLPEERPHLGPLRAVLERLASLPVAGFVYLSSTSVYGDRRGEWVDELSPPRPDSPWGFMRAELEQLVLEQARQRSIAATVLRLPEIYGPGRGPVHRLLKGYQLRRPERWTNRIHVDDLVEVLLELGRRPAPELLLCSDREPALAGEVYGLAAQLLGLEQVPVAAEGEEPTDPNRAALGRDSKRCRSTRLQGWLGRPLRYPSFREGLPATLAGD